MRKYVSSDEEFKNLKAIKREIKKRPRMRMHGASLRKAPRHGAGAAGKVLKRKS